MGYGGKRVHCIKIEPENGRERVWVARKDEEGGDQSQNLYDCLRMPVGS